MGVDRADADPIAFDATKDRSRTASSVMFRLFVKQREWFEDLVARAGL